MGIEVTEPFANRRDANRRPAARPLPPRDEDPTVVARARGGVPAAKELSEAVAAPAGVISGREPGATRPEHWPAPGDREGRDFRRARVEEVVAAPHARSDSAA